LGSVQGIRTALPFTSHGETLGIVKATLSRARNHRGRIPNLEILTCLKSTTQRCVQALDKTRRHQSLASIKQSAGRAGPHAEKGAEEKTKKNQQ
jgi:hypothetical protein